MIDYIELGNTKRPVRFGMNTLRIFTNKFNVSLNQLGNLGDMTFEVLLNLIYSGLEDGARSEKQQFLLTIDEVCDFLDEKGKLDEVLTVFANQFGGGEDSGNQEAPKK